MIDQKFEYKNAIWLLRNFKITPNWTKLIDRFQDLKIFGSGKKFKNVRLVGPFGNKSLGL